MTDKQLAEIKEMVRIAHRTNYYEDKSKEWFEISIKGGGFADVMRLYNAGYRKIEREERNDD